MEEGDSPPKPYRDSIVEEYRRFSKYSWMLAGFAWAVGLGIAGLAVFFSNLEYFSAWPAVGGPGARQVKWSVRWAVDPSEAETMVVGLAAVTATISVAVVVASWRPDHSPAPDETTIRRSLDLLALCAYWAAILSVTFAVLTASRDVIPGMLLLVVAGITTGISTATRGKRDATAVEMSRRLARDRLGRSLERRRRYLEAGPEFGEGRSAGWKWSRISAALFSPVASTVLLELVTILIFAWTEGVGFSFWIDPVFWKSFSTLLVPLPWHVLMYLFAFASFYWHEFETARTDSRRLARWLPLPSWGLPWVSGVVFASAIPGQGSFELSVLVAEAALVAPLTATILIAFALRGRGWGTCVKQVVIDDLEGQVRRSQSTLQRLSGVRPATSPSQVATRIRRSRR